MRRIEIATVALLASMLAGAAQAQDRSKGIGVNPVQNQAGINVVLELKTRAKATEQSFKTICEESCDRAGPTRLALGNEVAVCFKSSADGYVTVWSIDSSGGFDLIYPNKYSHPKTVRAAQVKADKTTCIGEDDKFRLRLARPAGKSRIYLHWTRSEDEQLGMDDYPVIGKDVRASPPYASTSLQYEVVTGN